MSKRSSARRKSAITSGVTTAAADWNACDATNGNDVCRTHKQGAPSAGRPIRIRNTLSRDLA